MIADCSIFFNELDLLDIRLYELYPVVDRFVVAECPWTFTGHKKPLYFADNRSRFAAYDAKIVHLVLDNPQGGPWERQAQQRRLLSEGIKDMDPNDCVIYSDADEIAKRETVEDAVWWTERKTAVGFMQASYYYYLNTAHCLVAPFTKMTRVKSATDFEQLRGWSDVAVPNGGWHFSYLGGVKAIQEKVRSYAHTELDRDAFRGTEHLERCLRDGVDLFGRSDQVKQVAIDNRMPHAVIDHPEKYKHLMRENQQDVAENPNPIGDK